MVLLIHKWLIASMTMLHPFFISVTEMNHNAKDKVLEISCKGFTDDLEKAISKAENVKLDLFEVKDKAMTEKALADYFKKHLQVKIDGNAVQLEWVGFEREGDATWCYFQVPNVLSIKKIEVSDTILHEASTDQINLLHITVGGVRKSTKLDYPNSIVSFQF